MRFRVETIKIFLKKLYRLFLHFINGHTLYARNPIDYLAVRESQYAWFRVKFKLYNLILIVYL